MNRLALILCCAAAGVIGACATSGVIPGGSENRTFVFDPEAPNFDMEAIAELRDEETGVTIYSAIPRSSLVYLERGGRYEASYELLVRITREGENMPQSETVFSDSATEASFDATQAFDRIFRRDYVPLSPGLYTVEVSLEDAESGATAQRQQEVRIPDVRAGEPVLSDVRLRVSRDGGAFEPAIALHLPGAYDSLRAVADMYNLHEQVEARLTLVRFASDTTVATPPFYFTPGPFSLTYIGVDYEHGDTLQLSRRHIMGAGEHVSIEFSLPVLEKGVYATELTVKGVSVERVSRRHFVVMGPSFPAIASLDEMIDALQYIAGDREWKRISEADSPEERRRRFDAFWAGLVPNRDAAARLLQTYYSRVEEANVLYSNHKAGWKTDFGMIYIVFGSPAYTDQHYLRKIWYYFEPGMALSRRLPPFTFRRSRSYGLGGLFEHYVLERDPGHEEEWRQRVQKWRDGVAM